MARILMVASEASPFVKTGGLGEVLEALPRALAEAGQQVAVALPLYRTVEAPEARVIYERLRLGIGPHRFSADILELNASQVRYFFARIPALYDREQLYAEQDADYSDNYMRFGALCHAALGIARYIFAPDVLHCHDWQAALLPLLLKHPYRLHPAYFGIPTMLTIHNLGYQGVFDRGALRELGLSEALFTPEVLEVEGKVNVLKGGIVSSDALTTVSPAYAREIQTPEFGFGLDRVLRSRNRGLTGILNGVDYGAWDPATDPLIPENFSEEDLSGKLASKRAVLKEAGFREDRLEQPLIGIVSRLAEQKGFDLLMQITHELLTQNVSLIVMGSGEQRFEEFFRWLASTYADRVAVEIGYDEAKAHRIYAGSDMLLMPSRYEPCGLAQIYAMRYGTLPLVRATGGLDDAVDENTGFKFQGASGAELLDCIESALRLYGTERWSELVKTAMQRRFPWQAAASRYIELYKGIMSSGGQRPASTAG